MRLRTISLATLVVTLCHASANLAALIVDPPLPITHRVNIQIIQTALDNGSLPATIFGSTATQTEIESRIDAIWAQAGIDIAFQPNVVRYNDTFAYQGNILPRPATDLNQIMSDADREGDILHPDPSVINMFFVAVVPGANAASSLWARGVGNVGFNGIAQFIGSDLLLGPDSNRDVIARVVGHEIGHNLGLKHVANGQPNLMSASGATTSQLTSAQIEAILQTAYRNDELASIPSGGTGFPQLLPSVPGDYNRNGIVDAADYALWRGSLGTSTILAADGNHNGIIDAGDYSVWRSNFGARATSIAASIGDPGKVPEPTAATLVVIGLALYTLTAAGCSHQRAIARSTSGATRSATWATHSAVTAPVNTSIV